MGSKCHGRRRYPGLEEKRGQGTGLAPYPASGLGFRESVVAGQGTGRSVCGYVCSVARLCPILCGPMDCSPPSSSARGISQARVLTGMGCHFLTSGDLSDPGIEPSSLASPVLAGGFFTTVPPGKPGWWCFLALVGSGEDSKTALATAGVSSGDGDSTNSHQCLVAHGSLSRLSSLWEALQRH